MEAPVRKILFAMIGALGIAFAVAPLSAATRATETVPVANVSGIDATTGYSHTRVLEPGSRGNVVEI
jgi:hypothetical protein